MQSWGRIAQLGRPSRRAGARAPGARRSAVVSSLTYCTGPLAHLRAPHLLAGRDLLRAGRRPA
eukprot:7241103-Pyramimonas_sp.AAC.1